MLFLFGIFVYVTKVDENDIPQILPSFSVSFDIQPEIRSLSWLHFSSLEFLLSRFAFLPDLHLDPANIPRLAIYSLLYYRLVAVVSFFTKTCNNICLFFSRKAHSANFFLQPFSQFRRNWAHHIFFCCITQQLINLSRIRRSRRTSFNITGTLCCEPILACWYVHVSASRLPLFFSVSDLLFCGSCHSRTMLPFYP